MLLLLLEDRQSRWEDAKLETVILPELVCRNQSGCHFLYTPVESLKLYITFMDVKIIVLMYVHYHMSVTVASNDWKEGQCGLVNN